MKIDANIRCCDTYWEIWDAKAVFLSEDWDFNYEIEDVIEETRMKIIDWIKHNKKIEWLQGREIRTFLFSFAPGKPFNIRCSDTLKASQLSIEEKITLS